MEFFRNIAQKSLLAIALCAGATACDLSENEEMCEVEMTLDFRFTRYGEDRFAAEVSSLSVFVFDAGNKFVGRWNESDPRTLDDGDGNYSMGIPLLPGTYSFVVWGGLDDQNYYIGSPSDIGPAHMVNPAVGETSVGDMAVRTVYTARAGYLEQRNFIDHIPGPLFFGEVADPVTVAAEESRRETVVLTKYTNTINLRVLGLPAVVDPDNTVDIHLHAANGGYAFRGALAENRLTATYPQHDLRYITENGEPVQTSTIHTIRPVLGRNDHTLMLFDAATGELLHTADLLEDYIAKTVDGSGRLIYATQQALDEEDTFDVTIEFGTGDPGNESNLGVTVTVNGWDLQENDDDDNNIQ